MTALAADGVLLNSHYTMPIVSQSLIAYSRRRGAKMMPALTLYYVPAIAVCRWSPMLSLVPVTTPHLLAR